MTGGGGLSIDGVIERVYARTRHVFGEALLAFSGIAIALLGALHLAVLSMAFGLSADRYLHLLVRTQVALAVVAVACMPMLWRLLGPVRQWARGAHDEVTAANVWLSVVARLPRAVAICTASVCVGVIPVELHAAGFMNLDFVGTVMLIAFGSIMTTGGGILIYLCLEQACRPVVAQVADLLPTDFRPEVPTVSLSAKLLGFLVAINVYTASLIAGLSNTSLDRDALLAVAVVTSLTTPLALALLLRRSLLLRLRDLQRAFDSVGAGDLRARLPNIAGDEIDAVGLSFNAMVADLRESRTRIVAAADASRRAVERDLHDGAQQHLVLLRLKLGLLQRRAAADADLAAQVTEARAQLDRALSELRDLAHGIYPPALTNDGLEHALKEAVRRHTAIPATVDCNNTGRYRPELEAAVYFCCIEALQNAAKHAGDGASVRVRLHEDDDHLRFDVADDGAGFDATAANASSGLQNMTDRVGALGGLVEIDTRPGAGTRVTGRVPIDP